MKNTPFYLDIDGKIYSPDCCAPLENATRQQEIEMHTLARDHYPGIPLKEDELENIKSIGYWNATKQQSWDLEWHYNEGIEICFLEAGQVDLFIGDEILPLHPQYLSITRPWLRHKIGHIGRSKLHWFIIDVGVRFPHQDWIWPNWIVLSKSNLSKLTRILQLNEQPVWKTNNTLKGCFAELGQTILQNNTPYLDSKIKICVNRILISLLELFEKESVSFDEKLISSKRSVNIFLAELDSLYAQIWTLENMAEYCGLGVTQFSKYCQEITNRSPMKFLNDIRLEKACQQLKQSADKNIIDIAFDCGFSSNQYFTRVFKERYGMSPQRFRVSSSIKK